MLDTSAYSHFRRGRAEALQAVEATSQLVMSSIVLGELWSGFAAGSRFPWNVERLTQFLSQPIVSVADVTDSTARRYGELFHALRLKERLFQRTTSGSRRTLWSMIASWLHTIDTSL